MKVVDSIPVALALFIAAGAQLAACSSPSDTRPGDSTEDVAQDVASSTVLTCESMTVNKGRIGAGQSYTALATRELSGTQAVWTDYVEFGPRTSVTCSFPVPAAMSGSAASSLSLRLNYRGPRKSEQAWVFDAWDAVANRWVRVGDNRFASDWIWSPTVLSLPAPLDRFLGGGKLRVRYRTPSTVAESSQLDELVGLVTWASQPDTDAAVTPPPADAGVSAEEDGAADAAPSADAAPTPEASTCTPACAGVVCGAPDGCGQSCLAGSGCSAPQDAGDAGAGTYWRPTPGTTWQYQLSGTVDTSVDAQIYDIDMFELSAQTMATLKAQGRKVLCYFSAGSYEEYRPDASSFPDSVKGNTVDGWAGEWWLDIRSPIVRSIMQARMDIAVQKGCDGVDPDLVDGFSNDNGLGLTYADQLDYNKFLATQAHARNLTVMLKNDPEQVADLVDYFDGQVNEECFQYNECDLLLPFLAAGKPVLGVEYKGTASTICPKANALNFDTLLKHLSLDAYRVSCR